MSQDARQTVLVVDDHEHLREGIAESLQGNGFAVSQAGTVAAAGTELAGFAYDALVVDLELPDGNGLSVLDAARARYPEIAAVVMTGAGDVDKAVDAMKRGARDFLVKPFEPARLAAALKEGTDQRVRAREDAELGHLIRRDRRFEGIIGRSGSMQEVFATLDLVAPMNSGVLIRGETGTGKELIARTIHTNSPRAAQRFVAFNAAAIPESLAEAELFGHTKGAFTGAVSSRIGRFELAHRGTLFIDEVAAMPLPLQVKLLRALQEREIERVGDSRPIKFDARVIAASNTDLTKLVRDGAFRADLFYRLNVVRIDLPPLRDRREDIPLLARYFAERSFRSNNVRPRPLSQATLRQLMDCDWPGNIRQLENAIEHAVAMSANQPEISPAALPKELLETGEAPLGLPTMTIPDEGINLVSIVTRLERDLILRCLEKTGGNKRQAARLLQLSRTTLIDKLHRYTAAETTSVA